MTKPAPYENITFLACSQLEGLGKSFNTPGHQGINRQPQTWGCACGSQAPVGGASGDALAGLFRIGCVNGDRWFRSHLQCGAEFITCYVGRTSPAPLTALLLAGLDGLYRRQASPSTHRSGLRARLTIREVLAQARWLGAAGRCELEVSIRQRQQ